MDDQISRPAIEETADEHHQMLHRLDALERRVDMLQRSMDRRLRAVEIRMGQLADQIHLLMQDRGGSLSTEFDEITEEIEDLWRSEG